MIKNRKMFLPYLLTSILQFSGIILAMVLEDLSSKKMGVARYLVFKKQEFASSFFTPFLIQIYTILFVIGAIICLLLLITKGRSKGMVFSLLIGVAANIIGIIFIQFQMELQAYHFFVIGMMIVIVVQYGWLLFNRFFQKN
ncbi:hypothetical protein BACCIP111895_02792 [Neobacillus rhizosphaerae]|uniref:Uncharacterized protein n=1 Tax=Neobacillus rhizosphaerae TaxID=2880965 RepID=A0ABM9ESK6_9BACI|nr:hypothetical protein [Neobacillus rhizosphaerae]CAH2715608.1 hypothetical protein BACCIP111895_02792 [Neobacillus rhizosphaerae]